MFRVSGYLVFSIFDYEFYNFGKRHQRIHFFAEPKRKIPKYKQLDLGEKNDIIKLSKNGIRNTVIAQWFGVSESTVSRIILNKDKYKLTSTEKQLFKKKTRIDRGQNAKLENILFNWIKQKRSLGVSLSGPLIKKKAQFFHQQLGGTATFKASQGWLGRFKARFGIRQLSVQGERLSADTEAVVECQEAIQKVIAEGQYSKDNVYNADETGLYSKSLPTKTLALADEKQVPGHKESKERVTIMNCFNATGTHKVQLLLIGKSQSPRCFNGINHLPVVYRRQKNAWMNSKMFKKISRKNHFTLIHADSINTYLKNKILFVYFTKIRFTSD